MYLFRILFSCFFILGALSDNLNAIFEDIEANCTDEEFIASGLSKLTLQEREVLEKLIYSYGSTYPAMMPKTLRAKDLRWVYEARPFFGKLSAIPPHEAYDESEMEYDLAVCAVFQNEASWLKEWIEYNKLIGVQHFYLYNNLSNDDYISVLEPYIKNGEVDLVQYPVTAFPVETQNFLYQEGVLKARGKARWLAIIDTDEFIVPMPPYNTLIDVLAEFEEHAALGINWQMHGTANVKSIPSGSLMIELLNRKAPPDFQENAVIKSIVKPHRVQKVNDPHHCMPVQGYAVVNSNHHPLKDGFNPTIPLDKVCINHYWSRTEDFYQQVKVPRRIRFEGAPRSSKSSRQYINTLNKEESTNIQRFVPALKKRMGL